MSIALDIEVKRDDLTPALAEQMRKLDPHVIATRIAPRIAQYWHDHLKGLPRNKNGYPSTGFWEEAARGVTGVAVGPYAKVTTDKLGLRQRYYGGTISAHNVQNLTIPICQEAYGTTVNDWGFENLVLVILADGRKFLALWLGWDVAQKAYNKNLSKLTKHAETTAKRVNKLRAQLAEYSSALEETAPTQPKKPNVIMFKTPGSSARQISRAERHANLKFLFVLKPSVEQAGNPNVLPPDLAEFAKQCVREAVQ